MKSKRHSKILEIINNNDIETQEELAEALKDAGYDVMIYGNLKSFMIMILILTL